MKAYAIRHDWDIIGGRSVALLVYRQHVEPDCYLLSAGEAQDLAHSLLAVVAEVLEGPPTLDGEAK